MYNFKLNLIKKSTFKSYQKLNHINFRKTNRINLNFTRFNILHFFKLKTYSSKNRFESIGFFTDVSKFISSKNLFFKENPVKLDGCRNILPWNILLVSHKLINFYKNLFLTYLLSYYSIGFSRSLLKNSPHHNLLWHFNPKQRLYMSLQDPSKGSHNYFNLSTGIFLKFYKDRRPLKRGKLFKFLLLKFVRKLLTLSGVLNLRLIVKRIPVFFLELYWILVTPPLMKPSYLTPHPIFNTTGNKIFIKGYSFYNSKSFGYMKVRRKGRVKRKVIKKLIKKNKMLD